MRDPPSCSFGNLSPRLLSCARGDFDRSMHCVRPARVQCCCCCWKGLALCGAFGPGPSFAASPGSSSARTHVRAHRTIGTNREENLSAERTPPLQAPRIPLADVDQGRPSHCEQPSPPGPQEALGLIQALSARASFDALSDTGRRRNGRVCWLRWAPLPADHASTPYIGYAIGRSVGNAVVRNRIRRRLRAILANHSNELRPGLYLFGVKHATAASIEFATLQDDVLGLVRAVGPAAAEKA